MAAQLLQILLYPIRVLCHHRISSSALDASRKRYPKSCTLAENSPLFIVTCQIMGSDHCNLDGHSIGGKKMQHLALHAFGALLALMIPVTRVSA